MEQLFTHVTVLAGLAVMAAQQILKLNIVPVAFANRYPVPTVIALSVAASIIAVWTTNLAPHTLADWVVLVATVAVIAAATYNFVLKNWAELRAMEGPGTKQ